MSLSLLFRRDWLKNLELVNGLLYHSDFKEHGILDLKVEMLLDFLDFESYRDSSCLCILFRFWPDLMMCIFNKETILDKQPRIHLNR